MSTVLDVDLAVVGGGIVGLATAEAVTRRLPDLRIVLLEKEEALARHQTSHNSGVVHAGIYYPPGSLRARLCVAGVQRLRSFCEAYGVAYQALGKVIVATDEAEVPRLAALLARGRANGVPGLRLIDRRELLELEPHAAGLCALHSPGTAIVDFPGVCRALARLLRERGACILTSAPVTAIDERSDGLELHAAATRVRARRVVACVGLHADRFARLARLSPPLRIVPFRGEYYELEPHARHLVRGLIYPVPDPALPFLGVHFTRTVQGEVEAGPNAVLAFAREGYRAMDVDPFDLAHLAAYPGFWRLGARYWRVGAYEAYRSLSRAAFVRSLQKLVPAVRDRDVRRAGAGVRAQAVGPDGRLLDDFAFAEDHRSLHVLNAPSPAATAALTIGEHLAERVAAWA